MVNPMIYCRICKRAKKYNQPIPADWKDKIKKYKEISCPQPVKIIFSWLYNYQHNINANAGVPGVIMFNAEWVIRIMFFDNISTYNAYKGSIGHELTHKENDFPTLGYWKQNREFIAKVNEVHADFGAAKLMFDYSRKELLDAITYKMNLFNQLKENKQFADSKHPTWQQRFDYIKQFDFNEELIRKIAIDVGLSNEVLIRQVVNHFEEIYLK